jgi:hypothetical protein
MARSLVLFLAAVLAVPATAAAATDYGKGVYNVLPPGQDGGFPLTKHSTDQMPLFDRRIKFRPGLLTETMRWSNRPTFQQVGQFSGHRKR